MPPRKPNTPAWPSQRASTSINCKTEIIINVYDLLPPGKLSSVLWSCGTSLLHSGVVIRGKEYAYAGHSEQGVTGVYWSSPKTEPPGGVYKCEILHGFTYVPENEIDSIIREVSAEFCGASYNLLTRNCNHFTAYLCHKLTDTPAPAWLNRAASIALVFPCIGQWVEPPGYVIADEEFVLGEDDGYDGDDTTERARMLGRSS